MSTTTLHPLASDYLARLDRASRRLPRSARRELHDEIESHLVEAIRPGATEAEVLTVLDRLGEPDEIVDAQQPRGLREVPTGRGMREWAAIWLLLLGGFAFGFGWIAGLIFLWSSPAWTTREKWIGTLIVPGGLASSFYGLLIAGLGVSQVCMSSGTMPMGPGQFLPNLSGVSNTFSHCSGGPSTVGVVLLVGVALFLVIGPIFTAVFLARRAGRA